MDNAPLRRGKATVHEKWNSNIAILSGDALFAEAFRMIGKSPVLVLPQVLELFTKTAIEVCEGQQLDMDFEEQSSTTIIDYLRMIELKTAILLAASLSIGAFCAGATAIEAKKLYEFGRQVGIAFQLQDDILDVYGNPETFGKQPGGDIIANKKTFLLLSAIEHANPYQREELLQLMQIDSTKATEKVAGITALYNSLNIRELAQNNTQEYYAAGIAALESVDADPKKKKALRAFTDSLMVRES
jgi:geranylgeranyl diphosphate synthase type II